MMTTVDVLRGVSLTYHEFSIFIYESIGIINTSESEHVSVQSTGEMTGIFHF